MLNSNIKIDHLNLINNYYKELNKELIENIIKLFKNNDLFNKFLLIALRNNIFLFKKKKDIWLFKTEDQIFKDYKMKKKTIMRKHASQLIEISKSEISENCSEIEKFSKDLKSNLKELSTFYKLYLKLDKDNIFEILKKGGVFNINDFKNLNPIIDYSSKKPISKRNEYNYIAEYAN